MTEQRKSFPEFYVTSPQPCPYLPERNERKLFTHLTHDKPRHVIDNLLKSGFRRSQNIAYTPYCDGCQACLSVRVAVAEFEGDRGMRRIWRRNRDIEARRVEAVPTSEQYALFRSYIDARHWDGGMADMSVLDFAMMVEDSIIETFITEYRASTTDAEAGVTAGSLVATALCDRLSDGLSMVYSFFDPDASRRSLGTYMILDHIELASRLGLPYVYLGYWIEGSRKMDYKARFSPLEVLGPDGWQRRKSG